MPSENASTLGTLCGARLKGKQELKLRDLDLQHAASKKSLWLSLPKQVSSFPVSEGRIPSIPSARFVSWPWVCFQVCETLDGWLPSVPPKTSLVALEIEPLSSRLERRGQGVSGMECWQGSAMPCIPTIGSDQSNDALH